MFLCSQTGEEEKTSYFDVPRHTLLRDNLLALKLLNNIFPIAMRLLILKFR